jgi:hypothetical protein
MSRHAKHHQQQRVQCEAKVADARMLEINLGDLRKQMRQTQMKIKHLS